MCCAKLKARTAAPEQILVQKNLATDRDIALAYAEHLTVPFYEPPAGGPAIDRNLSRLLPEKLCRDQLIVPIAKAPCSTWRSCPPTKC